MEELIKKINSEHIENHDINEFIQYINNTHTDKEYVNIFKYTDSNGCICCKEALKTLNIYNKIT